MPTGATILPQTATDPTGKFALRRPGLIAISNFVDNDANITLSGTFQGS